MDRYRLTSIVCSANILSKPHLCITLTLSLNVASGVKHVHIVPNRLLHGWTGSSRFEILKEGRQRTGPDW